MNREILFRGKRVDNEMWIYGDLLQSTDIVNCTEISENTGMGVRYDIIPETVGQYTGLTDKNGTKIFEGDIIKYKTVSYYFENLVVAWSFDYVRWIVCNDIKCQKYPMDINFEYEIIGNIYNNPELLKERDTNDP